MTTMVDAQRIHWLRMIRRLGAETWRYTLTENGYRAARRKQPAPVAALDEPLEVMTAELARASMKAQRFLRRYRLSRPDREDILQSALLWCWEHHDSYSQKTSLDTWFVNAVRDAYKRWHRIEQRESALKGE